MNINYMKESFLNIKYLYILCLFIFIYFSPSLRGIHKYGGDYIFLISLCYFLITFVILLFLLNSDFYRKIGSGFWFYTIIFIFITMIIYFLYPVADGLKEVMRGSDQDDCIIQGVNSLLSFKNPYTEPTYFGNPCSPGMGMLLAYFPFSSLGFYEIGSIVFAFIFIYLVSQFYGPRYAFFTLVIIFSSVFNFEMLVVGSDLFFIAFGMAVFAIGINYFIFNKDKIGVFILLSILLGLIASTRVNFLILVPVVFLFLFINERRIGFYFLVISAVVAFLPSFFIYYTSPENFTPLHLLSKSNYILSVEQKFIAVFFTATAILYSLIALKKDFRFFNKALFITISPVLIFLSYGSLHNLDYDFSKWEGANYLLPLFGLAVLLIIDYSKKDKIRFL